MALQMSALFSYARVLPRATGRPLPRVRAAVADFQRVGVKLNHTGAPGSPQPTGAPVLRGHINAARRAGKFSTTTTTTTTTTAAKTLQRQHSQVNGSPSRETRGWLVKVALGTALGVGTVALVQSLHTGTVAAMAHKVDLNSAQGDWNETKVFLLSLSEKERRQYYRTSDFVSLDKIPVWTPTAGGSEPSRYQRNEKLDQKISLYTGDITKLEIDAIVNAAIQLVLNGTIESKVPVFLEASVTCLNPANNSLLGGGGVDGAIHRAAGPKLKMECASLHGCETGEAKITCGYGLPAKYVIHTVGPIAQGGVGEAQREALRSCYKNSLKTATENAARSVAFPCISTGIYGYPPEKAVHEALATVREYLEEHHDKLDRVIFCVFLPTDKELYLQNLPLYFPAA